MHMKASLRRFFDKQAKAVEAELKRVLARRGAAAIPFLSPQPAALRRAMAYSLLAGGKRLRPVLVAAATETCGVAGSVSRLAACAVEMIHTYSLIHDDLPAMDDDDLRRGKPTNHKVFGEAMAILAGDGLLTLAFELAAENAADSGLGARETAELVRVLAAGAGARGMVGGQVMDLQAENSQRNGLHTGTRAALAARVRAIHTRKTAALITASLEAGAILGRASFAQRKALRQYGRCVGLAFQIADDVLDVVGDKAKLGKRGSDEANAKLTYARLYGIAGARQRAEKLLEEAHQTLEAFPSKRAGLLHGLADYVVQRDH